MADQKISLKWDGRGDIRTDNITPVGLKPVKRLSYGSPDFSALSGQNLIIEGDNAPVMKSLVAGTFRLKGRVNLMLWDPPYNTGHKDFLYNDDYYLTSKEAAELKRKKGERGGVADLFVSERDASRHTKWLSFMEVRLDLAKRLLAPSGVVAVHISYQELFRLGLLMDEVFGENNRLGIINWECAYSPKNDNKNIPSTTDYILVYAKDKDISYRGTLPRTESMDAKYGRPDGDKREWRPDNFSASHGTDNYIYGIENPFTGDVHYPPKGVYWRRPKNIVKEILSKWGVEFEVNRKGDVRVKKGQDMKKAERILERGPWPELYFGNDGKGRPTPKRYKDKLRNEGRVVGTYWEADEVLDADDSDDDTFNWSLRHELSGHNDEAKKLMKAVLGGDCPFDTPKPVRLTERLVEMFCPKDGIVLDAFGGSATTAHAVLNLNSRGASRHFVLIERGSGEDGFCDTITSERVKRVINGKWVKPRPDTVATGGSFAYLKAGARISGKYIMASKREELSDIILTSHVGAVPLDDDKSKPRYVIGKDAKGRAIALAWDHGKEADAGRLTMERYREIMDEVKRMLLVRPVFIYATSNEGPNGSPNYTFHQIPNEILAALEIGNLTD
jgi:adenine-specific DNA-methyltransferase